MITAARRKYWAWMRILAALALAGAALLYPLPPAGAQNGPDIIPGKFVVVVARGESPREIAADYDLRPEHVYRHALNGFSARASDAQVNRLRSDPRVESVGHDRVIRAFAQSTPTGVNRVDAEPGKTGGKTGQGIRVAIIDSGLDRNHPDLSIDGGASCTFIGGKSCGPGASWDDDNSHGTHVGGTVAAVNNDTGVVGVAPGATLLAMKVLNSAGSGSFADITASVDHLACTR